MKRTVVLFAGVTLVLLPASAMAEPSDLSGRYALGLGWGYIHGVGSPNIAYYPDASNPQYAELGGGSILDAPKIISSKFGINSTLAIEPSVMITYSNRSGGTTYNDESEPREKTTVNIFALRLQPVVSYALFQRENANFNVKGGLSFTYANEKKTDTRQASTGGSDISTTQTTSSTSLVFGVPVGFGIEWWMTEHLAFDITTMADIASYVSTESGSEKKVTGQKQSPDKTSTSDSGFSMALGNFTAMLSLMFWF